MIGTGAISHKHAQAYKNIGFELTVCTDIFQAGGRRFAEQYGAEFVSTYEEVCRHPKVDYVDVCTFPDFRMQPIAVQPLEAGVQRQRHERQEVVRQPGDDRELGLASSWSFWSAAATAARQECSFVPRKNPTTPPFGRIVCQASVRIRKLVKNGAITMTSSTFFQRPDLKAIAYASG